MNEIYNVNDILGILKRSGYDTTRIEKRRREFFEKSNKIVRK